MRTCGRSQGNKLAVQLYGSPSEPDQSLMRALGEKGGSRLRKKRACTMLMYLSFIIHFNMEASGLVCGDFCFWRGLIHIDHAVRIENTQSDDIPVKQMYSNLLRAR